jgi:hypothetical protein
VLNQELSCALEEFGIEFQLWNIWKQLSCVSEKPSTSLALPPAPSSHLTQMTSTVSCKATITTSSSYFKPSNLAFNVCVRKLKMPFKFA